MITSPSPVASNASNPFQSASKTITVVQGDYAVDRNPQTILTTLLGSCVSVCLFDPASGLGGMNHFLLPDNRQSDCDVKYGSFAMEILINELIKRGAQRSALVAKTFGGARMNTSLQDIGAANAAFARDFLRKEGITCAAESVGGVQARRIQFHPATGAARQKFVPQNEVGDETALARTSLRQAPEITLF